MLQTFTHNHVTNKQTHDASFGTRNIDMEKDKGTLDQAARMLNCGSNFKHIKEFLAFEFGKLLFIGGICESWLIELSWTGKSISTQQARNILRLVQGKTPLELVKAILGRFGEAIGNHVVLVQDQLDITVAIAIQSRVQKQCFADWGDCLVMDWTHSTNNLGYHLGEDRCSRIAGHVQR